ncbi:MAG: hypothetical protein AAB019_03600 [Planctomycetota bacterium]
MSDAIKNSKEAIELCLKYYTEDGKPIPQDQTQIAEVTVGANNFPCYPAGKSSMLSSESTIM